MSQTLHQIYQSKAIVLARTMVVKFHSIALATNEVVREAGYSVDENNPASWKYYMNMFGEYHPYDHDRLLELSGGESKYIRIKVAGETVAVDANFNKALLFGENADQGVANEYRFNTQYYKTLVSKYPEFEDLILGVLNPVSPAISLVADDGEILYCGGYLRVQLADGSFIYERQNYGPLTENYLIEPNEENLIYYLREHINTYLGRWWNVNYVATHDLFLAQFVALMTLTIPQILGNIRLINAKSPNVHSFFIRQNMESMGRLGWVCEYLSLEVLLWLHRNVSWLDVNRGKTKAFKAILDNVLSPSGVKLSGYRLRHDISKMGEDGIEPHPFMEKIPLNYSGGTITRNEIIDVVLAEAYLATENQIDQEGQAESISDKSKYSVWDDLYTRVLESTITTNNSTEVNTREDVAMNMWLYCASNSLYRGTIIFTNPFTNQRVQLTPLNAYILTFYCFNVGYANYYHETIPDLTARLVARHDRTSPGPGFPVKPKLADIRKGTLSKNISDAEIRDILGAYVPNLNHASAVSFAEEVSKSYLENLRKYKAAARVEDAYGRGMADWIRHLCYWYDLPCKLTRTKTNYADWLLLQGFDLSSYSRAELITLGINVVEAATGVDLNAKDKLKNKHSALLAILRHFSNYTTQIIQNNVSDDYYWLDNKGLRLTNFVEDTSNVLRLKVPVIDVKVSGKLYEEGVPVNPEGSNLTLGISEKFKSRDSVHFNMTTSNHVTSTRIRVQLPRVNLIKADIPDVVIDTRIPMYVTQTSALYPMYGTETLTGKGKVSTIINLIPPIEPVKEVLNIVPTFKDVGVLTPPLQRLVETIDVKANLESTIYVIPTTQGVKERLAVSAKFNPMGKLITPSLPISDSLVANFVMGSVYLTSPPQTVYDVINATATVQSLRITNITGYASDKLNVHATVDNVKLYFETEYAIDGELAVSSIIDEVYIETDTVLGMSEIVKLSVIESPVIDDPTNKD